VRLLLHCVILSEEETIFEEEDGNHPIIGEGKVAPLRGN
jgi:hypothetical protein